MKVKGVDGRPMKTPIDLRQRCTAVVRVLGIYAPVQPAGKALGRNE